jgi:FAD synthase
MVVPFDQSRAHESAEDFVRNVLARDLSARLVVVGTDFHFGRGRAGNVEVLTRLGRTHGFRVVAAPLRLSEGDPISSSRIRRLIAQGNMETAALLLGRPHCVTGTRLKGASMEDSGASFSVVVPADIAVPAAGLYFGDFGHEHGSRQDALLHVVDDTGLERLIDLRPLNTETGGDNSLDSSLTLSLSFALKLPRMKSGSLITRELANQFESADVLRNTSARRQ